MTNRLAPNRIRPFLTVLSLFFVFQSTSLPAQWIRQTPVTQGLNLNIVDFYDTNYGVAFGYNDIQFQYMLYTTTDGGTNWNMLPSPTSYYLADVEVIAPNTIITTSATSLPGNVWATNTVRSTDMGLTWDTTVIDTSFFLALKLEFPTPTLGLMEKGNATYRTTDGGLSWDSVAIPLFAFSFADTNTVFAYSLVDSLYRSNDGGLTWASITGDFDYYSYGNEIHFLNSDTGAAGRQYSAAAYACHWTTDGGLTWIGDTLPGFGYTPGFDVVDWDHAYVLKEARLWRSTSHGVWVSDSMPTYSFPQDTLMDVVFLNQYDGWAVGSSGAIFRTNSGGCDPLPRFSRSNPCAGDTITLMADPGWNSFVWTDSATSTVLSNQALDTIAISAAATIYFQASHPLCGTVFDTLHLTVSACDSVWPGDANADGIANMYDLLNIGYAAGAAGPPRTGASNAWTAQNAIDFGTTFGPVVDYKHADCNGNGVIDVNDTLALSLNYSLTHNKTQASSSGSGVPLYLVPTFDSLRVGDTGYFRIVLGTAANPVTNLHGIAFTFLYDNSLIDTNTVLVNFDTTWISPGALPGAGMYKDFYQQGRTDIGYTHINQLHSSGFGTIGGITVVTIDNISGKKESLSKYLKIDLVDALALDSAFEAIAIETQIDSVLVFDLENDREPQSHRDQIVLYPNPTNGLLRIESGTSIVRRVEVHNLQGFAMNVPMHSGNIDLSTLTEGMYFIKIETNHGWSMTKVILRK